jgi:hypothetical protein
MNTKGPWIFKPIPEYRPGGAACEIFAHRKVVARAYAWGTPAKNGAPLTEQEKNNRMKERHANAFLISAAPELLEACEIAIEYLTDFGIEKDEYVWKPLIKAIAKAKGVRK